VNVFRLWSSIFGVKSIQNLWPNQHQLHERQTPKTTIWILFNHSRRKRGWGHLFWWPHSLAHLGSASDLAYNLISSAFASSYLGRNPHPHPHSHPHPHPTFLHNNPKGLKVQKPNSGHSRWLRRVGIVRWCSRVNCLPSLVTKPYLTIHYPFKEMRFIMGGNNNQSLSNRKSARSGSPSPADPLN